MIKKFLFGETITYNEVFSHVEYIDELHLTEEKLYDDSVFTPTSPRGRLSGGRRYYHCFRKLIFKHESGNGIVIGECSKKEGEYFPGDPADYEMPYLAPTKTYSFWIVATDMNRQILIQKSNE